MPDVGWFKPWADVAIICDFCGDGTGSARIVRINMLKKVMYFHEGHCWDQVVMGVFAFNSILVDEEEERELVN